MKKYVALLLAMMVLAVSLAGCGGDAAQESGSSQESSQPQNRLEKIKAEGKIVMATSPDFAPNEFIDPTKTGQDAVVGADIELAKHIAQELGVELVIEQMDFASVLTAVTQGKVDMAISGLAYKPDRAEQMGLSSPFNTNGYQGLLIRAEDNDKYQELSDFNGKVIAAQSGSLQQTNVETQLEGAQLELISNISEGIMMLKTGKVDALAMSGIQGEEYTKTDEAIVMAVPQFTVEQSGNHVGVPKGEDELLEAINEIVEEVESSGQYAKWQEEARELAASLQIS